MIDTLLEKYLGEKKKLPAQAPKGYEWVNGKWKPKKKKVDESSLMGAMWWNKRANLIYVRDDSVLFSSTAEFPTGSSMTAEDRTDAKYRGFILIDW